jgi:Zn finger protein HypA/HybF involved in hydrogenase expression
VHELSIALEVCRIAGERLEGRDASMVRTVAVEVGVDSNIEIESLRFCLEAVLADPPWAGAVPALISRPGPDLRLAYLEVDDGRPDD